MNSDLEILRYGMREERDEVMARNPKALLRHIAWVQAGCPDLDLESDDQGLAKDGDHATPRT